MKYTTLRISGGGPCSLLMPRKVVDGKVIAFYKSPSATFPKGTGDSLMIFLSEHQNLTISEILVKMRENVLIREETTVLQTLEDAGWGRLACWQPLRLHFYLTVAVKLH